MSVSVNFELQVNEDATVTVTLVPFGGEWDGNEFDVGNMTADEAEQVGRGLLEIAELARLQEAAR